jgi:glycosyltransferase involved in cell wall biosynthesis
MPVWRPRQDWLEVAVGSALAQAQVRLEVIVIDDGNDEPVADLLKGFDDPRLRIERIAHSGYAGACNAGIELARGDYVRFADADDCFPAEGSAELLGLANRRREVLVYGATLVCDEHLRPLWRMRPRQQGDAMRDSLLARFNVRLGGGLLWPRDVLRRTGQMDTAIPRSADWEYIQRALEFVHVVGTTRIVHHYRRHASAMTADVESGRVTARTIVERYFERHPEQRGTSLERRALAMLDATAARIYATHGEPRRALAHLARGLGRDPLCLANEFGQLRAAARGRLDRLTRNCLGPAPPRL